MTAPTLSNVITRLIDAAEAVINRPALPNASDLQATIALYEEVDEAAARSARAGDSVIGAHETLLADVLVKIVNARAVDPARVPLWCQIAGVLLPVVREDLGRVIVAARAARPSTTEQDYAGGGRR